jgi:hypothetical protein
MAGKMKDVHQKEWKAKRLGVIANDGTEGVTVLR